jgi:hypothetical protein
MITQGAGYAYPLDSEIDEEGSNVFALCLPNTPPQVQVLQELPFSTRFCLELRHAHLLVLNGLQIAVLVKASSSHTLSVAVRN